MTKELRRKHLLIWITIAILVPPGILSAWLVIPGFPVQANPFVQIDPVYPILAKSIKKDAYTINLRKNNTGEYQLEWISHKALVYPTATIYLVRENSSDLSKAILIGRFGASGNYRFPLTEWREERLDELKLVLYDFIHEKIIDTITF